MIVFIMSKPQFRLVFIYLTFFAELINVPELLPSMSKARKWEVMMNCEDNRSFKSIVIYNESRQQT